MRYELFVSTLISLNLCLFLILFAVFGPVFIDRSISYHIAFIAAQEEHIYPHALEEKWKTMMMDKRMEDALSAGMLQKSPNGLYRGTGKAKRFTAFMMLLGKATRSLDTYEKMKARYDEDDTN